MESHVYVLKNVLLETGFEYEDGEVVGTRTDLFCVEIAGDKIKDVRPNDPHGIGIDAKGHLMLPAFKDMHAHLDKTLFGLPWQAVSAHRKTVKDMIAYEQEMIPEWLRTSVERSGQLMGLLQSYGTHFVRSHFNIDPTSGFESLAHLEVALGHKERSLGAELVAFPQHGIYYTPTAPLLKEIARWDAVGFIGGLDPYSIDGEVEKPMELVVQLALDNDKGIDIHLHERGESGKRTIEFLIDKALENPRLKGRTYVSHAFALGHMEPKETERMAERLAHAGVGIVSSVPFSDTVMPIPMLKRYGVEVLVGSDNVQDHWATWGSGNMLQKANLIAQLYGQATEWQLSRTLGFATRDVLPLSDEGVRQWPREGDDADWVLLAASCSAEAVSRIAPVKALAHKGHIVFGP